MALVLNRTETMTEEATSPGADAHQATLTEVVKGLAGEPELLFGIGAGIVLVAVLAATTSVALVAIVAVVLLVALGAWTARRMRRGAPADAPAPRTHGVKIARTTTRDDAEAFNITDETGDRAGASAQVEVSDSTIAGGKVGNVRIGPKPDQE